MTTLNFNYSEYNPKLYTEKLAGGIRGCLGFVKDKNGYGLW